MSTTNNIARLAASCRESDANLAAWARGYGAIEHTDATQVRKLAESLVSRGRAPSVQSVLEKLRAAGRLRSAAMWLVVHMTYARTVDPTGRPLEAIDFKSSPEGHTGGPLNVLSACDIGGMLFANARTWAHIVHSAAKLLAGPAGELLTVEEIVALEVHGNPHLVMVPPTNAAGRPT